MKKSFQDHAGFTLLEILLVVACIGILAGIVILALNPAKQLADTRNAQRRADVTTILNAVYQYSIDHNGAIPNTIPTTTPIEICYTAGSSTACGNYSLVDLHTLTDNEKYLTAIPHDPSGGCAPAGVCYQVSKSVDGRITVYAPGTEQGIGTISVTR